MRSLLQMLKRQNQSHPSHLMIALGFLIASAALFCLGRVGPAFIDGLAGLTLFSCLRWIDTLEQNADTDAGFRRELIHDNIQLSAQLGKLKAEGRGSAEHIRALTVAERRILATILSKGYGPMPATTLKSVLGKNGLAVFQGLPIPTPPTQETEDAPLAH